MSSINSHQSFSSELTRKRYENDNWMYATYLEMQVTSVFEHISSVFGAKLGKAGLPAVGELLKRTIEAVFHWIVSQNIIVASTTIGILQAITVIMIIMKMDRDQ